ACSLAGTSPASIGPFQMAFYTAALRVRPAQLSAIVKRILNIRRLCVQAKTGDRFLVDPVSVLGAHLIRESEHEPGWTRALQHVLRPGDIFLDVGGNEGYFSVLASKLVAHGRVHCIEPQSRLQSIIENNLALNSRTNVLVHRIALSREDS